MINHGVFCSLGRNRWISRRTKRARFLDAGRRLWSWISPVPIQVQLVSRRLPTGQLEVRPEYSLAGKSITNADLKAGGLLRGYRYRIPSSVKEIESEFQGKRLRLRPRAAREWLHKYADQNISVVDEDSGRRMEVFPAEAEIELELKPDESVTAQGILSRPDGVEIDADRAKPVPNEPGWFELDETIFERPVLSPALDEIIDAGKQGCALAGDAIPNLLVDLETHKDRVRTVKKNKPLEDRTVFHGEPANTLRVDGDDDKVTIEQSLTFTSGDNRTHEESLVEAEDFLRSVGTDKAYRTLPEGWVQVRKSDTDKARRARKTLSVAAGTKSEIRGPAIPEVLSALAEEVRRGSPWNIYVSEKEKSRHSLVS